MKLGDYGELVKGKKCKFCGTVLNYGCIEYYDHEGGFKVEGFDKKQWLYINCFGCGHDWSLVHLGVARGVDYKGLA